MLLWSYISKNFEEILARAPVLAVPFLLYSKYGYLKRDERISDDSDNEIKKFDNRGLIIFSIKSVDIETIIAYDKNTKKHTIFSTEMGC